MAARQLSDARTDGQKLGQSASDLIGFWGTAGVVQGATVASVNTTAATSTTNAFGYTTSTQADAIVTAINAIIVRLQTPGFIASA